MSLIRRPTRAGGLAAIVGDGTVYVSANNLGLYSQPQGSGAFGLLVDDITYDLGLAVNARTGDVYAAVSAVGIYVLSGGAWSLLTSAIQPETLACNAATGDVYAVVNGGDLYKQTGGSGLFVAQSLGLSDLYDVAVDRETGDVFVSQFDGNIYKQTGGVGTFSLYASGTYRAVDVCAATGDVYAVVNGVDIYRQVAGTGAWIAQSVTYPSMDDVAVHQTTGDVYVTCDETSGNHILRLSGGTWTDLGAPDVNFNYLAINS